MVVVAFAGEVDLEHSPQAREILLEQVGRRRRVLVDLSAVDYIDSSGIASPVEAFQKAKKTGIPFALAAPNPAAPRARSGASRSRVPHLARLRRRLRRAWMPAADRRPGAACACSKRSAAPGAPPGGGRLRGDPASGPLCWCAVGGATARSCGRARCSRR